MTGPMARPTDETCWTLLRAASDGEAPERSSFSHAYEPVIRGFLAVRWRGRVLEAELDDAVQEVFVECLRPGGVLVRADPDRGDFRGLLFGVVRNVARRYEERYLARGQLKPEESHLLLELQSDEPGQATEFDRSWARALVQRAKDRMVADAQDEDARRHVELLELRFGGDLPVRDIARRWDVPTQEVHGAYRQARRVFGRCLREVVAEHLPAGEDLDEECRRVLDALG